MLSELLDGIVCIFFSVFFFRNARCIEQLFVEIKYVGIAFIRNVY
jgi:hypothetical protein